MLLNRKEDMSGLGWELRQGSVGREKREKRKGEMQTFLNQWSAVSLNTWGETGIKAKGNRRVQNRKREILILIPSLTSHSNKNKLSKKSILMSAFFCCLFDDVCNFLKV